MLFFPFISTNTLQNGRSHPPPPAAPPGRAAPGLPPTMSGRKSGGRAHSLTPGDPLGRAVHADAVTATRLQHDAGVSAEPGQTTGAARRGLEETGDRPAPPRGAGPPARSPDSAARPRPPPQDPHRGPARAASLPAAPAPARADFSPNLSPVQTRPLRTQAAAARRPPSARTRPAGLRRPGDARPHRFLLPRAPLRGGGRAPRHPPPPREPSAPSDNGRPGAGAGPQRRAGRPAARPSRRCLLMPPAGGTGSPGKLRPAAEARRR